jgi:DNA-binding XRE family transcriptional regulator
MPVPSAIPWTDQHAVEFIDTERELLHATYAANAMAEKYDCSWRSVYVMLEKTGIPKRCDRRDVPGLVIRLRWILAQHPAATDEFIVGKMMSDACDHRLTRETTFRLLGCVRGNAPFTWLEDARPLTDKYMTRKSHAMGMFLKRAMIERGMTTKELARLAGVNHGSMVKLLGGRVGPALTYVLLACKVLGVTIEFSDANGHIFDPFLRAHADAIIDEMGGPDA